MKPLQEKLLKAIEDNNWSSCDYRNENTYQDKNNFLEINTRVVSTACHKICLESQIELLDKIKSNLHSTDAIGELSHEISELQTELNNLNK